MQFERTGGFAGMRIAADVEGNDLPEEERRLLEQEIESAQFFDMPNQVRGAGNEPDRFQYTITVEQGGKRHTIEVGESAMPDALRPLVEHLGVLARSRR